MMTAGDTQPIKATADPVQALLFQFDALQADAFASMREMQLGAHALLQREESRLVQELGEQHVRVQQVRAEKATLLQSTYGLRAAMEQAQIRVPETATGEVLIHGRVLDDSQRGISGLRVYMAEVGGQAMETVGAVTTDATGYYALRVKGEALPAGAVLTIATARDKVILRETPALNLAAGAVNLAEFSFDRLRLAGIPTRRREGERSQEQGELWVVTGQITDAAGKPLPGLLVSAFDRDRKYDDKLGSALSNEEGRYTITYYPHEFREGPEPGADLYVTVIDIKGQVLFTLEQSIRYNAGQREVFDIQIPSQREI